MVALSSYAQKKSNSRKPLQKVSQKKQQLILRNTKKIVSLVSPYSKKLKRFAKQGIKSLLLSPVFHRTFKMLVTVGVVTSMLYGSYLYISKTFANEIVVSQSEIISRVGKLISLPSENPFEIVRVQDEEDLRKQNEFYKDVKEGDYILMYKNLAVIYDLRTNTIVASKQK